MKLLRVMENGWKLARTHIMHMFARIDRQHKGKVKPLIRFIKAWKYYRDVPISSFYLEMRVAKYAEEEETIVYDIDIKRVLVLLRDNKFGCNAGPYGSFWIYISMQD